MRRETVLLGCATIVVALAFPGAAALAHEGEEETSAKELVLQGIALLRGQPEQTEAIEDKIHDALEAEDQTGVDFALVERGDEASRGLGPPRGSRGGRASQGRRGSGRGGPIACS